MEKIVRALNKLEPSKAAEFVRSHPERFRNSVMPAFEKMSPQHYEYIRLALYDQELSEPFGGYRSFEQAASALQQSRDPLESSRLVEIVDSLVPQINFAAIDPEIIRDMPAGTKYKIFARVQALDNNAPIKWQQAMREYGRRPVDLSSDYFSREIQKSLNGKLEQLNSWLHRPSSSLQKDGDELQSDIAERLGKIDPIWLEFGARTLFRRFPLDIRRRLIRSIINYSETQNLSTETSNILKTLKLVESKMVDDQRKQDLDKEETNRSTEATTPEEIALHIGIFRRKESNNYSLHYSEVPGLEKRLSQAAHLPKDASIETLQQEEQKHIEFFGFAVNFLGYEHSISILDRPTVEQVALIKKLYAAAPPELQQALVTHLKVLSEGALEGRGRVDSSFRFFKLREQAAGLAPEDWQNYPYQAAREKYQAVLQNPQITPQEIIQAFVSRNREQIRYLKERNRRDQQLRDYEEKLAQQAGIRINYESRLRLREHPLEEIPQS